jgi:hypothetical protein
MMSTFTAMLLTRRAYDHRLRENVFRGGTRCLLKQLAILRSTVSTWQQCGPRPAVTIEPTEQDRRRWLDLVSKFDRRARILAVLVSKRAIPSCGFLRDFRLGAVAYMKVRRVLAHSWARPLGRTVRHELQARERLPWVNVN